MKTIIITGASSGIGATLAKFYLTSCYKVGLIARRGEPMQSIAKEYPDSSLVIEADISDKDQVNNCTKLFIEKFGRIDIAILNAGISIPFDIANIDLSILERTIQTNYFGVANFLPPLISQMKKQKSGKLVSIGSQADVRGFPLAGAYSSSKIALNSLMEAARIELRSYGIDVLHIRPGFIYTPMVSDNKYPMPFIISAEKATIKITKAIKTKKGVYSFPWQTKILTQFAKYSPNFLFDRLGNYKKHKG